MTRMMMIRGMEAEELAAYLDQELGDSTPVDWLAWLTEEGEP